MRAIVARLLVVLSIAAGLWVGTPGSASAQSCSSGFRAGAPSDPFVGVHKCNGYAGNGARVLGAIGVGLALLLVVRSYRRGARASRAAYPPPGPPAPGPPAQPGPPAGPPPDRPPVRTDEQPRLERFAASALAGELGGQPWTTAVLRVGAARDAGVEVHRPDGVVDTVPANGDAAAALLELRDRMAADGPGSGQRAALTLSRAPDGQITFTVEYE